MSEPAPLGVDALQAPGLPSAIADVRVEGRSGDQLTGGDVQRGPDVESSGPAIGRSPLRFLAALGPGLITGAADDDPSGIATYSQAGAQFGFAIAWTMLFSYPLMVRDPGDQRAGSDASTGRGIAGNLRALLSPFGCCSASSPCCSPPIRSTSGPTLARWATPCS